MFEGETVIPWERKQGEPKVWYYRFAQFYLPLGEERTFEQCYRVWRANKDQAELSEVKRFRPSQRWYKAAAEWDWKNRAEAWDKDQRKQRIALEAAEQLEWQEKRRQLMVGLFAKVAAALQKLEVDKNISLSTVTQAIKLVLDQNRLEYGLPTEISQVQQVYDIEWRESNEN